MLLTIDTLRADRLGAYGYFRDTSPVFDALARQSLLFERCMAPMATTFPSHLSLLTSTWPGETGALANVSAGGAPSVSNDRLRSLAEILAAAGYQTGAFVSATPLKAYSGLDAGFHRFDQPEGDHRSGRETDQRALAGLESLDPQRPLFLWVHYFEPHAPYAPDPDVTVPQADAALAAQYLTVRGIEASTEAVDLQDRYDREIRSADQAVGALLSALGERLESGEHVLVIVGDHGEGLGQHGEAEHGGLWDEQLRVPLLIRAPGVAPARIREPVALVDVIPTLMGLSDLPGRTPRRRLRLNFMSDFPKR